MGKKLAIGTFALLVVAAIGAGFVSAFPMGFGGSSKEMTAEEIGAMYESRQAITTAIENQDYSTWKTLMEEKIEKMKSELTEENFNKIVEMHNSMKERDQQKEQIKNALEGGDYETAKQLMENSPNGFRGLNMRGEGFI